MKKNLYFLFVLSVPIFVMAQPVTGITDFESHATGVVAASGASPKSGTVDGWAFTIFSAVNAAITIGTGPSPSTNHNVNLITTPTTTGIWQQARIASSNGSNFQLKNLNFHVLTVPLTSITMTFQGYLDGSAISGASITSSTIPATNTIVNVDFTGNAAFNNIDEIRFTPSGSTAQGTFALEDITIAAAIVLSVTWNGPPSVKIKNGIPAITWSVAQQFNNSQFEIERSYNGQTFTKIGAIAAADRATYSYDDLTAKEGIVYYRIAQTDIDGRVTYSGIVFVRLSKVAMVKISPNPAINNIEITLPEDGAAVANFFNASGILVKTVKLHLRTTSVDIYDLAPGIFYVNIKRDDGKKANSSFTKK